VSGNFVGFTFGKTGVKVGDVLLKVAGQDVASLAGFSAILRGLAPGQTVRVVLRRAGSEQQPDVTVVER
jgi:S1-C subfamily serine protease